LNALPFRIAVFATQLANLALLSAVARRLTGRPAVGFLAPVLWLANSALALPMCWTSAYNQILCAFLLLLSFYFLLRYQETGRRGWWIAQWASFAVGFGVLELIVVYPAIAASYAVCRARSLLRKSLWLFLPSVVFAAIHWRFAEKPSAGLYAMHFDAGVFATLWRYWEMALGPSRLIQAGMILPPWLTGGWRAGSGWRRFCSPGSQS